jgi:hypothetical protein
LEKEMSELTTPETDAENAQFRMGGFTLDFCRKLERERDEAREQCNIYHDNFLFTQRESFEMKEAILTTLEENRHLADGDNCTLAKLKSVVPEWK